MTNAEISSGIEDYASEIGHQLLFITGCRARQRELAMLDALLEYHTEGLILVSLRMPGPRIAAAVGSLPWSAASHRRR
jgi:DNA-binding LacI/PurR family transcriptional regulator